MRDDMIDAYVREVQDELPLGRRMRARIATEIHDYIYEAVANYGADGLSQPDAKRKAVERFGAPHAVARAFAESRGVKAMATTFTRWAGVVSILGAFLIAASLGAQFLLGFQQTWADGLGSLGVLALAVALVGVHFRQRGTYGGLGRIGFRLVPAGLALMALAIPFWSGLIFFSGELIVVAGLIAVGIASWRAAILPRGPFALIPLGITTLFVSAWMFDESGGAAGQAADLVAYAGILTISTAFAWIGTTLWRETPTGTSEHPPAVA